MKTISLKKTLDKFYREYDFKDRISHDPVAFPRRYKAGPDMEVAGFISSCLAYGKVELFASVIEKLLGKMGTSPYDFLLNFDPKKQGKAFAGVKYRFNENEDILCLFYVLREILKAHSTIEDAFKKSYSAGDETTERGLAGLTAEVLRIDTTPVYGKNIRSRGFRQFFPSPIDGSACKRANLFLRWMIRDRDIDLGLWKGIPKDRLVIPLDTHIARISRCLGFTTRRSQDWKTAVEITTALKQFDAEDPLKYDFALCHHGISGLCKGKKEEDICRTCAFKR